MKVNKGSLLDGALDLSELFNPGTFLNALRQQTARKTKCAMDTLQLVSCWDGALGKAALPVTLRGLLLQGATFDGRRLEESASNASEMVQLDKEEITLAYVGREDEPPIPKEKSLPTPLYYSTTREKMLVEVSMPTNGNNDKWIIAGVGLFLYDT